MTFIHFVQFNFGEFLTNANVDHFYTLITNVMKQSHVMTLNPLGCKGLQVHWVSCVKLIMYKPVNMITSYFSDDIDKNLFAYHLST